ncbi:putative activating signal cointegrator 1 complex subunit 3 [Erysiphe necator]|uniref:Putative activating signal cointegrator 1 complex subunit 3 n=1 Tax=Uncinula necator TaxID=52586 RepID=A0A0B1PB92_UNCNE|nr:putative activating signal cointegrator 1 complex subunit 3 [Erysiphe necator]
MPSNHKEPTEIKWQSQITAMKLGLQNYMKTEGTQLGGHFSCKTEIEYDNDDDSISLDSASDIWDFISESGEEDLSSQLEEDSDHEPEATSFGSQWLESRCHDLAKRSKGFTAEDIKGRIIALLVSDSSEEELESMLTDVIGLDDFDFIIDIITHRSEIKKLLLISKPIVKNEPHNRRTLTKSQRQEVLRKLDYEHKNTKLAPGSSSDEPRYPHVYRIHSAGNILDFKGRKYGLPIGSKTNSTEKYEEHIIPGTKLGIHHIEKKRVDISDMDGLCRETFKDYKSLNRMQSLVYPVAYQTSENMLICAPTGAGKTDTAMLTILHTIGQNTEPKPAEDPSNVDFAVNLEDFKIIYVAPMKALAAEITQKFSNRLSWLGISTREYTGDIHLTKKEIQQTQIIVTTPEKWDVITRKSTGDTELVQKVKLLIIDEVHMLHDDRGSVLESLIARTQRQVESTQSLIRIVGLSATLPNYIDVADFLKVNRYTGLFYFDASFRPVPLEQHFIGVKGKPGSKTSRDNIESASFDKVREMLQLNHQVMVFVHSRKDTYYTANMLYQKAIDEFCVKLFDPSNHPDYDSALREIKTSRGRELRELLPKGMGIHHAGMARADRSLIAKLFARGVLKVLCCTATLAWGVNLPAAAVVIKGTQVYSAQDGKFIDLSILDVHQIFGRAGRPQFQDTGIGMIVTSHDKLSHYLSAVTAQAPIESRFSKHLVDNLNAEISLGTVTSIPDAIQWLGYSYLYVRMQRNPLTYGIEWSEKNKDPNLVQRRRQLVIQAARTLRNNQMIIFNETTDELRSKDVGRIASQFYIRYTSIEIFNNLMSPLASEADILSMISMSAEFDNIQSRDNETEELKELKEKHAPCAIKSETPNPKTNILLPNVKTNILLQSLISRANIQDFALMNDSEYIAQQSARICRGLYMIALNRHWGYQCLVLLSLCKSIEKRLWSYQHPLHQFELPKSVLKHLDSKGNTSIETLRDMDASEIGSLVHNFSEGKTIRKLLKNFPTINVESEIAPLNRDILKIRLYLIPEFTWNDKYHMNSESFWVWVENSETSEIYHHEYFILSRKKFHDDHQLDFTIPLLDPLPTQIYVRVVSDRWLGAETVHPISFQHLIRPDTESVYTDLLKLQPLPISALKNPALEEIYGQKFQYFNPMQTQIFHCLYHTPTNVLLGSPTGSGKTIACELAMWWAFREHKGSKVIYIAPMKALVRERVKDWRARITSQMNLKLVELTGDITPDTRSIREADIIVTTPEKWDGISRGWATRKYVQQVSLVIIDEIHLLGGDRGPILEIIVSRMNYIATQSSNSIRIIGMSTACANALDLGNWLGVKEGLFNFRHSVRPVPLEIFIDGFPEVHGFCPLMKSMNRPTFLAIKTHSPEKPTIVFVPSRRQTRLTAKDLVNLCAMEDDPRRFLNMSEDDLQMNLSRIKDDALKESLTFGIGLHHAGLVESDRSIAEELFINNKIQILIATSTLAWGVNLPAHLVVVKGTQYYDAKIEGYRDMDLTDVLQMLGRAGRPQFDTSGIARIFTQDTKKAFYKNFLHTGFPVESSLHKVLDNHLGAEISTGTIKTKQDALDYLTWTFFFRRLHKNPSYYGLEITVEDHNTSTAQQMANDYMISMVDNSIDELAKSQCLRLFSDGKVEPTSLGKIMSYYYISHHTIRYISENAKPNASFADVASWMSSATEYDELPVRHNEEFLNAELSRNLPLSTDSFKSLPMWDPHIKAFLLLQAHISRIDLPITDYVGDQTSVLDQSIRIIQATIDVLAEMGYLSSVLQIITLLQSIKCARWPTDNPLSILPGIEVDSIVEKNLPQTLQDLSSASDERRQKLINSLNIPVETINPFTKAANMIPNLDIKVINISVLTLTIEISRKNSFTHSGNKMYAPFFPKSQTEGYIVIVCCEKKDEVIALKRVGWSSDSGRPSTMVTFQLPEEAIQDGSDNVDIWVLSDGYLNMIWKIKPIQIPCIPQSTPTATKEVEQRKI